MLAILEREWGHKQCLLQNVYSTMTVFEFPPSESCSSLVNLLLRYGMCVLFPSTRADITIPRLDSERLMLAASSFLIPVAPVLDSLSEPLIETKNFALNNKSSYSNSQPDPRDAICPCERVAVCLVLFHSAPQ